MKRFALVLVCVSLSAFTSSTHHKKKYPYFHNRPYGGIGGYGAGGLGLGGGLGAGGLGLGGGLGAGGGLAAAAGGLPLGLGALGLGGFRPGLGGLSGFPFPFLPNTPLGNSNDVVTINRDPPAAETNSPVSESEGSVDGTPHSANPQPLSTPIVIPFPPNFLQVAETDDSYYENTDEFKDVAQDRQGIKVVPTKAQGLPFPGRIAVLPIGALKQTALKPQYAQPSKASGVKTSAIKNLPEKQLNGLPPGNTNLLVVLPTFGFGANNNNNNNNQFQTQFGTQNPTVPNIVFSMPPNTNPGIIPFLQQLINNRIFFAIVPGQQPQQQLPQPQLPQQQPAQQQQQGLGQQQQQQTTGSRQPPFYLRPIYAPPVSVPGSIDIPTQSLDTTDEDEEAHGQSVTIVEEASPESGEVYTIPDSGRSQKDNVESRNDPEDETPSDTEQREEPESPDTPESKDPHEDTQDVEPPAANELVPEEEVLPTQPVETRDEPPVVEAQDVLDRLDYVDAPVVNSDALQAAIQNYAKIVAESAASSEPTTTPPPATV